MTILILTATVILCAVCLLRLEQSTRDDEHEDADEWWVIR